MERTKYTPKRLLSLLLALIMLLGMLPTAVFAAEPEEGPVVTPYTYNNKDGLVFTFTVDIPDGPYFEGGYYAYAYYTITKADDNVEVSKLTSLLQHYTASGGPGETTIASNISASDERFAQSRHLGTDGRTYVFDAGTVLASGQFMYAYAALTGDDLTKRELNFSVPFSAAWEGVGADAHYATQYGSEETNSIVRGNVKVANLPTGCSVMYNDGGYTGVAGIPEGTFRTTGSGKDDQSFTISDVTPTLAGCTFRGWSSDTWVKLADDGTTALTGKDALFQPEEVVQYKVIDGKNTVLTAVWEPTEAANTHTVTFDVGVANAGPVPGTQVITSGQPVPAPTVEPTRDGYTFAHWYLSTDTTESAYNFATPVTKDITLRAKWTRNQVKITWPTSTSAGETLMHPGYTEDANHSTMVDVGSTVTFRVQWYKEYDPATVLANDLPLGGRVGTEDEHGVTYTYQFTANEDTTIKVNPATRKTFTITLPSANGCDVTFADCQSWRRGRDISAANGSTSYTFEYGDKFKVKLDVFADTRATLRVDGTAVLSNVDGNSDNPTQTTREFTVDHAYVVTVSARAVVTRMVTFSLEPYGGLYTIMPVENGSKIYAPAKPEIPGYEFGGWYKDANHTEGNEWNFLPVDDGTLNEDQMKNLEAQADVVKGNIVIYGQLTALTYDVTYNANLPADKAGATVTVPGKQTKTHGEVLPLSKDEPTLTGYTFKGWATSKDGPVAYMPGSDYVADAPVELFAVWAKNTYTVTISAGTGYSTVPSGTATVEWGETFTLAIKVDASHSSKTPTIKYTSTEGGVTSAEVEVVGDSTATELQWTSGHPTPAKPTTWYYKIENVHKDYSISISIDPNDIYPVSFYAVLGDGNAQNGTKESAPFLIQSVEHGYYASMPAAPEREGYKFDHWERDNVANTEVFSTQITAATEIRAVYKAIVPKITVVKVKDANNGWELKNWQAIGKKLISFTPSDNKPYPISYGDDVTFDLVIQPGYDYSKLSVSANGYELGRESIKTDDKGVTTISFRLVYVTANTRITVSGIERKTITVTYNENALDHVSNLPAPQTANYWIEGNRENSKFVRQAPVRNGYTFLGWSTVGTRTAEDFGKNTATDFKWSEIDTDGTDKGVVIPFTKDTTVYAIWEAQKSTVILTFGDTALKDRTGDDGKKYDIQYEGKTFTLNAEFNAHVKGTAIFYVG